MEKTVKKNYYLTPAVKVVAFQVEGGFAGSPKYVGHNVTTRTRESSTPGTEVLTEQSAWTGQYF